MTAEEFRDAIQRLQLRDVELCRQLSVDSPTKVAPQTIWRWKRGERPIPPTVSAYIRLRLEMDEFIDRIAIRAAELSDRKKTESERAALNTAGQITGLQFAANEFWDMQARLSLPANAIRGGN